MWNKYAYIALLSVLLACFSCGQEERASNAPSLVNAPSLDSLGFEAEMQRMGNDMRGAPKWIFLAGDSLFSGIYQNPALFQNHARAFLADTSNNDVTEKGVLMCAMVNLETEAYIGLVDLVLDQYRDNDDYNNLLLTCVSNDFGNPLRRYRNEKVQAVLLEMERLTVNAPRENSVINRIRTGELKLRRHSPDWF